MQEGVKKEVLQKYIFLALAVLLVVTSYFILKPYLVALLSAFVLGFLMRPVYVRLEKKIGSKSSAWICILLLILIIFIPFGTVVGALSKQVYDYASKNNFSVNLNTLFEQVGMTLNPMLLDQISEGILNFITYLIKPFISNVISFLITLFVMFFGMYYVLLKWDYLANELKNFIPFGDKEGITKELSDSTKEIVYGTFLIGLIEFVVALVGFYVLGIDSAMLLSALIFFTAFIPAIGPGFVWLPLALYLFIVGNVFAAIGVVIIGLIIGFGIDFFLRGMLTGRKSQINPLIMLLGIFGGVAIFGLFGFIIGPLILIYAIRFLQEIVRKN
jgi:predicted PurR-regulated permease PerM